MSEAQEVFKLSKPSETLLIADAMTGQDAVQTAKSFSELIKISGVVLNSVLMVMPEVVQALYQ